jgi:predicted MPP superfamily phosphohydrolase
MVILRLQSHEGLIILALIRLGDEFFRMNLTRLKRGRIAGRLTSVLAAEAPLRQLAENLSAVARNAMAEANSLALEEVEIRLRRLPKRLDGFRIVHLSDIHHSPFTEISHILEAVEAANRLEPDLVVLTGDFVSHEPEYVAPMAVAVGGLRAAFGVYACLGNHDHWTDAGLVERHLGENGVKVLVNRGERLTTGRGSFWISGVDDYLVGKTDVKSALEGSFRHEMKLMLAHNPVIVRQAARRDVDLVLSGHTHGGQVKLRRGAPPILARRRLTNGLHRRLDTQIYITRGIGTVVLPVRYQCPPEISLLTLRSHD